ncbi:mdmB, partial [Symbiodinium sp. KB8]
WKGHGGGSSGGYGDWQEDQISIAVSQALSPILPRETEWDQAKLEKRVKQYFRNAAKGLEFYSKTWDALIEEYSDTVFASLFQALKDRPWLVEVDFLMVIDAAVKELFPKHLLKYVPQVTFESQVLHAHDRAFEEQRFAPMLWDILFEKIQDKPLKNKIYNAFEAGRKEAALSGGDGSSPAGDFIQAWVPASLRELQQGPAPLGEQLSPESCKEIFHELLEAGALPLHLTKESGVPPESAMLIDSVVEDVYSGRLELPPPSIGRGALPSAERRIVTLRRFTGLGQVQIVMFLTDEKGAACSGHEGGGKGGEKWVEDAWDFQLQETPCRLGVREVSHMERCLAGSWIVLIGASQASVWTQQLVNLLAPGALDSLRDDFVSDGVYLHLLDLVIEDGRVVHKVVGFEGGHKVEDHRGAHSDAHDAVELPRVYARLAEAPLYNSSSGQIRVTHLIAEYWDEAESGLVALDMLSTGGWKQSPIFLIVGVGLWYGYAKGCALDWCDTRPSIAGLGLEAILAVFTEGMQRMAQRLQTFCNSGRAALHGCTVTSIEYCSELYQNTVYVHLHQAMKREFRPYVSKNVRYFDMWEFLEQVPEDCLFGHMSPASASFMIQAVLQSVCPTDDVAPATLIAFVGKACRSRQIVPDCPGMSCGGYMYTWDYALAQNCKLVAAVDPELEERGYQPALGQQRGKSKCTFLWRRAIREKSHGAEKPLASVLQSLAKQPTAEWNGENWRIASSTVLQSVRTKTATMADLVSVLTFLSKASSQNSRDIANPEWNQWMLSDELLTAVLDEVSQPWKVAELPSQLLQSLCDSCLDLQLVLPRRLRDSLARRMLVLLGRKELSPAVDVLAVLCALDPNPSPGTHLSRWGLELMHETRKQRLPGKVLQTLLLHVGYVLYLHLCGVPNTLSARLSRVSLQGLSIPTSSSFMFWERLVGVRQDPVLAQWVFSSLLLTAAVLIARYARPCMKAVKVDEMLDPILPFKVGEDLEEPPAAWWSEDWGAGSPKVAPRLSRGDGTAPSLDASDDVDSEQRLLNSPTSSAVLTSASPKVGPNSCGDMVFRMPPKGDRYSFGLARYLASLHVVLGHLNARGQTMDVYMCNWGFTWVPWFFMLSGFILCTAEMKNPRKEQPYEYVARRFVTIYPVYAVSLLIASVPAVIAGTLPSGWVLLMQAWLMQAWVPTVTEKGLQMQCWFLSCLVVYWTCFPTFARRVSQIQLQEVLLGMAALCSFPVLYMLIPDLFYGTTNWYEYHSWGKMRNATDIIVIVIKFHPICYLHVFLLGMLLARLRLLLSEEMASEMRRALALLLDLLAPVGYFGLLLVFNVPAASPPYAKLSARILVLLPLQAAILLGLAGLEGFPQPKLAKWVSGLNFLESYSYCVYVMQFICMKLWAGQEFSVPFFMYLIAIATLMQVFVQRPAEVLWKISPLKAAWMAPAGISMVLLLIWLGGWFLPAPTVEVDLPAKIHQDGLLDVRLPLVMSDKDMRATGGGVFINPSIAVSPDGNRLIIAARLHRRSSRLLRESSNSIGNESNVTNNATKHDYEAVLEEIWHSQIVVGSVRMAAEDWRRFFSGQLPGPEMTLRPWSGLRMEDGKNWTYPNLCEREKYVPENKTLIRLVVTGPEDPKVIPLMQGYCDKSSADCSTPREPGDLCGSSRDHCRNCHSRWCSSEEVQIAFSSYTPKAGKDCKRRDVMQMFLASGVDAKAVDKVSQGLHLKCGQWNHNEKNWIPFQRNSRTYVVYSLVPHLVHELVHDGQGTCGSQFRTLFPPLAQMQEKNLDKAYRGSGQAVHVDASAARAANLTLRQSHFLALFHVADLKVRRYWHYAYRFSPDPPFQILQVSKALPLQELPPRPFAPRFAFASGLAVHGHQVTIAYAAGDREPRALSMTLSRLDEFFAYVSIGPALRPHLPDSCGASGSWDPLVTPTMHGPTSVADASFKVKNTFLEIAPVEEEAALRKRRSRSDGHDLKKSPLVVASKSPIASPLSAAQLGRVIFRPAEHA